MSSRYTDVGGQAVIEGVLMKHADNVAIAVRKPNRKITVKKETHKSLTKDNKFLKLPFIRGGINLIDMMILGYKALTYSANESLDESGQELSTKELIITMIFSLGLGFGLFFFLPLLLTQYITNGVANNNNIIFNFIDGIIRISFFVIYVLLISLIRDIKRLFEYHGAEHKAVNCYESGQALTIANARTFTTCHKRCGTSFIFYVLFISIIVFSIFSFDNVLHKFIMRIVLLPIIAGISYEVLKLSAKHDNLLFFKILVAPGLALQKLTTREPNDKQLEVALKALKEVI